MTQARRCHYTIRLGVHEQLSGATAWRGCVEGMWLPIGFNCLDSMQCTQVTMASACGGLSQSLPQHGVALCQGPMNTSNCD